MSNLHITRIQISPDDHTRSRLGPDFQGVDIELKPGPNLIIGPNGSGKSTVFRAIRSVCDRAESSRGAWDGQNFGRDSVKILWSGGQITDRYDHKAGSPAVFYDGITDNRVLSPMIDYRNSRLQMQAMRSSHGQGLCYQVSHAIERAVNDGLVLCLDEPDGSLDIRTVSQFSRMDALYQNKGVQSIIISHHPIFLLAALKSQLSEDGLKWGLFESEAGSAFETSFLMVWPNDVLMHAVSIDQLFLTDKP